MTSLAVFLVCVSLGVLVALGLIYTGKDKRSQEERRGWRLRCISAGSWIYEEKKGDAWSGFLMEEQTDYREPPHHMRVMSAARWSEYPEWMQGRRDEILGRIRSELKEPRYVLKEA
jgi:hypothetical protein